MSAKVTVAIPTYNRSLYFSQALESVISQSYVNLEIVISDNHSNDGTDKIVKQYVEKYPNKEIKYYRLDRNYGAVYNWENCVKNSTGDYLLILSDDDILSPDAVCTFLSSFDDDVLEVIGNTIIINSEGFEIRRKENISGIYFNDEYWKQRLKGNLHDTPSAVMFRRKYVLKYFNDIKKAVTAGDMSLSLLISEQGKIRCINSYVVSYRIHESNDSNNYLRCSKSHVLCYQLFKNKNVSKEKLLLLQDYCKNVIVSYAHLAFKNNKFYLMMQILFLLNKKIDLNLFFVLLGIIKKFIYSKFK